MKQHGNHYKSYCKMLVTLICVPALFACSDATTESASKADASAAMKNAATENMENKAAEDNARAEISEGSSDMASGVDYHSFSNPDEIRVTHLALELSANFDTQQLSGSATLKVERTDPKYNELVLDTRALKIETVKPNRLKIKIDFEDDILTNNTPLKGELTII